MLKFRGHHLICLHFFQGEGYNQEFIRNLQDLTGRAEKGEIIEVVAGADDICRACPHAEAEIRKLDYQALRYLGASAGEKVTWDQIKKVSSAPPFLLFVRVATGRRFATGEDKYANKTHCSADRFWLELLRRSYEGGYSFYIDSKRKNLANTRH